MKKYTRKELINLWLNFYKEKGHAVIPSASVIPENDASVLFTTAGMHPLVPYLLGESHPAGKRLTDVQKCIRTGDIDEVGDGSHLTFFEMLGNWSLGDYFKQEKVAWSYEFLTSEKYIGLKKDQLAVTCFAGDENAPKDTETHDCWLKMGVPEDRIFYCPKKDNWWEISRGPCGPDSEMFLDTGKEKCCPECNPSCDCGKYIEIGNDVYMQYEKISDTDYIPAKQKNVDTGFGLERNLMILNGAKSVYETELFEEPLKVIEKLSGKHYCDEGDENTRSFRIIADHIRTATAILGDKKGIVPSNTDAGYILRRLIRRSIRCMKNLGIEAGHLGEIANCYIEMFKEDYPEFLENKERIITELNKEEEKFLKTLSFGVKEFQKVINGIERHIEFAKNTGEKVEKIISGKQAFRLYETFGFPLEMTIEMANEQGYSVDSEGFKLAMQEHQELARTTSAGKFKGGLADDSEKTTKLHTAVHLMNAGLRKILNDKVFQKGSNITSERARFDFSYDKAMTKEEIAKVEDFVNDAIKQAIPVECSQMSVDEAKKSGAIGVFDNKYGDIVKVFTIGNVSKEICGGPHAKNTADLGHFKIIKEESCGAGVRRIKAILE